MAGYAVKLTTRYDGMVVATFPDLPGVSALGVDDEDARAEAKQALEEALAGYRRDGIEPPEPSASGATIEIAAPALA